MWLEHDPLARGLTLPRSLLCPAGFFCPPEAHTSEKIRSPAQHYSELGSAAPIKCDSRFFCVEGMDRAPQEGDKCPAGSYCRSATQEAVSCATGVGIVVGTDDYLDQSKAYLCALFDGCVGYVGGMQRIPIFVYL